MSTFRHLQIAKNKGFTLLEVLLVVAAIAILAGIVIVAINPGKQLAEARNAKRTSNVTTLLNAVYQYSIDNNGNLPNDITVGTCTDETNEICITGGDCTGLVNLQSLTDNQVYLVSIPEDPNGPSDTAGNGTNINGSGYHIVQTSGGRITVCAPNSERGLSVELTK